MSDNKEEKSYIDDEQKAFNELLDKSLDDVEQGKTKSLDDFLDTL